MLVKFVNRYQKFIASISKSIISLIYDSYSLSDSVVLKLLQYKRLFIRFAGKWNYHALLQESWMQKTAEDNIFIPCAFRSDEQ